MRTSCRFPAKKSLMRHWVASCLIISSFNHFIVWNSLYHLACPALGPDLYDISYAVISPKKNCGVPVERDRRYALLTLKQFLRQLHWLNASERHALNMFLTLLLRIVFDCFISFLCLLLARQRMPLDRVVDMMNLPVPDVTLDMFLFDDDNEAALPKQLGSGHKQRR